MAFNFNWTPLAADNGFYERARELLTNALNRGGLRPAIIVDDILVHELNLGDVPPELELLEIGDLGEDRFRGTFKMSYEGNALVSLKTKVEANPLNTYLHIRPAFASPQPLAAATSLQIPLQITLSDFRLSGIITLVFSRQKGLTLVSRNDNLLRSVRVSSTFDSISFVANYLQKEIEGQLRILLTDELPAIIHRLSLRMFVPEHKTREEDELERDHAVKDEPVVDPFASPPQDPVDATGHVLSPAQIASLSLDSSVETQSLFSQKNLIRLATLTDSQRTLSLFTPSIRDVVFRAWTGPLERGEGAPSLTRSTTPALSRSQSFIGNVSQHTYTFENSSSTRPSLYSFPSAPNTLGSMQGRLGKAHPGRKRKKRIVNLRKKSDIADGETISEDGSTVTDTASVTNSESTTPSVFSAPPATISSGAERINELVTPPRSPLSKRDGSERLHNTLRRRSTIEAGESSRAAGSPSRPQLDSPTRHRGEIVPLSEDRGRAAGQREWHASQERVIDVDATPRASMYLPEKRRLAERRPHIATENLSLSRSFPEMMGESSRSPVPNIVQFIADPANGGSIVERAWMLKIVNEVARRYEEDRTKGNIGAVGREEEQITPPPAYAR